MTGIDLGSRKLWLVAGAALTLLILLAGWFLAISPKRSDAAALREQTAATEAQNARLRAQDTALIRQGHHLGAYQKRLAKALAALPGQTDLSSFSQSLTSYAARSGVKLTSISVGTPTPVVSTATAAPTPESTESSSDSTSSTAAPAPSPTSTSDGPVSTTFTLEASGTSAQDLAFLDAIRTGARSALVTSAQFSTGTNGKGVTLSAQVNVFSSPMTNSQLRQLRKLLAPAS